MGAFPLASVYKLYYRVRLYCRTRYVLYLEGESPYQNLVLDLQEETSEALWEILTEPEKDWRDPGPVPQKPVWREHGEG